MSWRNGGRAAAEFWVLRPTPRWWRRHPPPARAGCHMGAAPVKEVAQGGNQDPDGGQDGKWEKTPPPFREHGLRRGPRICGWGLRPLPRPGAQRGKSGPRRQAFIAGWGTGGYPKSPHGVVANPVVFPKRRAQTVWHAGLNKAVGIPPHPRSDSLPAVRPFCFLVSRLPRSAAGRMGVVHSVEPIVFINARRVKEWVPFTFLNFFGYPGGRNFGENFG